MSTYDAQQKMREAFKKLMAEQEGLEQRHAMVCEELDDMRVRAQELQRRLDTLPRHKFPPGFIIGLATGVALMVAAMYLP